MNITKISSKDDLTKKINEVESAELILVDTLCNEKEARRILDVLKQKSRQNPKIKTAKIAIIGGENSFNRRVLETLKINFLVSPEREIPEKRIFKKDTLKQRDSGLNHVLAKIAKEKNISITIDFNEIKNIKDKKAKALRLSRIIQNIKICRKAKCKILIIDFENKTPKKELEAFGFSLGMSSQQVRKGV